MFLQNQKYAKQPVLMVYRTGFLNYVASNLPMYSLVSTKLSQTVVPFQRSGKHVIIPVPKISEPTELNHYRPVALTSNVMKCFERILLRFLKSQVGIFDLCQFAYQNNRSVADAVLVFLHRIYQHLEARKSFARSVFFDFSSAFNTIVPHIPIDELLKLNVYPKLALILHSFLIDRPQWVKRNQITSHVKTLSVGAPQGCVIPPLYFRFTSVIVQCQNPVVPLSSVQMTLLLLVL